MAVAVSRTLQILREVLTGLPIPISVDLNGLSEPADFDQRMERPRQLIHDIPMHPRALENLDLAILSFLAAFDVSHIAHHREEILWREDAVFALLGQSAAYLAIAVGYLQGIIEEEE
jgi:hypothetical protein